MVSQAIRTAFVLLELGYQEGYLSGEPELGEADKTDREAKIMLSDSLSNVIFSAGGEDLLRLVKNSTKETNDTVLRHVVEMEGLTVEEMLILALAAKDEMQQGTQVNRMGYDLEYAKRDMAMELLLIHPNPNALLDQILKEGYLGIVFGTENSNFERLRMLNNKYQGFKEWLRENGLTELLNAL